jgi:hypothetical protein
MRSMRRRGIHRPRVVVVTYRAACTFVRHHHSPQCPPQPHTFSIGLVTADRTLIGVAMVGRPAARHLNDGRTAELSTVCTDATRNVRAALLAAAWCTARAMGYHRMITYTQDGEPGTSLRAAGWRRISTHPTGRGSDRPNAPHLVTNGEQAAPTRWQVAVNDNPLQHTRTGAPTTPDAIDRGTHGPDPHGREASVGARSSAASVASHPPTQPSRPGTADGGAGP